MKNKHTIRVKFNPVFIEEVNVKTDWGKRG